MRIRYLLLLLFYSVGAYAQLYEISGSPYATKDAPLPEFIQSHQEKLIIVDPNKHAWGAYNSQGKLIRWGLATAGRNWCEDIKQTCKTLAGEFRVYFLGNEGCASKKFPVPSGGAPMPYCMYFNGGHALHGSSDIVYGNESHGCIRVHISDAKWLRYQFVEAPNINNDFRGTKIIIYSY